MFLFADADLKYDQPQTEVVFDRDKLRSQGVDLRQAGQDLSTLLGGNYVNRFSIQGRSYKVIPQVKRTERLTADQLSGMYVAGSGWRRIDQALVPLSTFAELKTTAQPRELKKFQQLNAVRIQGVIPPGVPLDAALSFLETEARALLPQGATIDFAGESRQLRKEGSRFLGTLLLSAVLIYLVLAAQFESFRDPFIILAGSVPLAVAGALLFSFLGFTSLNIYSQVGLITLVGLVAKNGILIVQFANHLQESGKAKLQAILEASETRLRPILMTTAATVVGHFPLVIATGPGRRRAEQHRRDAGQRHDHRHALHAVRRAVDLHAAGADAGRRARRRPGRRSDRGGAEPGAVDVDRATPSTSTSSNASNARQASTRLACRCLEFRTLRSAGVHGRGRRHRPRRHRTECRRRLAVVRRRLVGRCGLDHGGVAARPRPEHHADRHGVRHLRLDLAGDLEVVLLVGGEDVLGVVGDLRVAGRHVHLGPAEERRELDAAADRWPIVHLRFARVSQLVGAVVCSGLTKTSMPFSYITFRTIIRSTDCIFR